MKLVDKLRNTSPINLAAIGLLGVATASVIGTEVLRNYNERRPQEEKTIEERVSEQELMQLRERNKGIKKQNELEKRLRQYQTPKENNTPTNAPKDNYTEPREGEIYASDIKTISNVVYAEAANQSSLDRKLIAKEVLNRKNRSDYPNTIDEVIFHKNAYTSIKDSKNKNWNQATGEIPMNPYESKIYNICKKETNSIINGEKLGIPRESEIVAHHDTSIEKPNDKYWNSLELVHKTKKLKYYAPKKS